MTKIQLGTLLAVIGGALAFGVMSASYFFELNGLVFVLLIVGTVALWLGLAIHRQGKFEGETEESVLQSPADIFALVQQVVSEPFQAENRGSLASRFDRYEIDTTTWLSLEEVLAIADQAAVRATPMAGKFVREESVVDGGQTGFQYVIRTGVLRQAVGSFVVVYTEAAGANEPASLLIQVHEYEEERLAFFFIPIPFLPKISEALLPFRNWTRLVREGIGQPAVDPMEAPPPPGLAVRPLPWLPPAPGEAEGGFATAAAPAGLAAAGPAPVPPPPYLSANSQGWAPSTPPPPPHFLPSFSPPPRTRRWTVPGILLLSLLAYADFGLIAYAFIALANQPRNQGEETYQATANWHASDTETYAVAPSPATRQTEPSMIPDCPGTSELLAWAELENGWVLVCGFSATEPRLWVSEVDAQQIRSTNVAYRGPRDAAATTSERSQAYYQADLGTDGAAQLDFVPATLSLSGPSGKTRSQSPVPMVYFIALGTGGTGYDGTGYTATGQGLGAYGLDRPDDTAEEQVRYLAGLLEKSYEGRAQLGPAVDSVYDCPDAATLNRNIQDIKEVRDNRNYLLTALQSTPVDKVPQGASLVSDLTSALQNSRDADVGYLEWAEGVRQHGCGYGSGEVGDYYSGQGRPYKAAFAQRWNSVIAPHFDVQRIDPGKL